MPVGLLDRRAALALPTPRGGEGAGGAVGLVHRARASRAASTVPAMPRRRASSSSPTSSAPSARSGSRHPARGSPVAEPIIDARMNTLVFHLRVESAWIAAAPLLTLRKSDAIRCFECRNLLLRRHNLHQPEQGHACRLQPRAAVSLRRPALLERQSGHKRSCAPWKQISCDSHRIPAFHAKAAELRRRLLPSRRHFRATTLAPRGVPLHGRP